MKKSKGQFDDYKKWTSDTGYTFLAKDKEDAEKYLKMIEDKYGLQTRTGIEDMTKIKLKRKLLGD